MMAKKNWRETFQAIPFLSPALVVIGGVLVYPLIRVLIIGFYSSSISRGMRFVGLQNYVDIFQDKVFFTALQNTFVFSIAAVSIEIVLGFLLATILTREFFGRNVVRGVLMVPMLASPIVSGIMWRFMYNPDFGIINYFFSVFGLPTQIWTGSPKTALLSCIIVDIWAFTPFVILLLLAGLQSIPKDQYEAAMIDGAGAWGKFKFITLPWLRPMLLVVLLLRTMDCIKVFDQIYALTGGGPGVSSLTVGVYAYVKGFRNFHFGYAAAISWVLALITIVICIIYIRSIKVPDRGD